LTPAADENTRPARQQGCDAAGKLWLQRLLETASMLETDQKHVEMMLDADEEIKATRKEALKTIDVVRKVSIEWMGLRSALTVQSHSKADKAELARGVEVLLSFLILQTYDENEDALDMLEVSLLLGSWAALMDI
jgi:DNA polymerase phi